MGKVDAMGTTVIRGGSATTRALNRVLEHPDLLQKVRDLPASRLTELIRHVGLEDAGELLTLASNAQLERLFDEEVWVADGGHEQEELSADRFALWLEVLAEAGDQALAERLANLPFEVLLLGYGKLVFVLNEDTLLGRFSRLEEDQANELEKRLDGFSQEQWQEFRILARLERHWDVAWSALSSLDTRHSTLLRAILEHCERLSYGALADEEDIEVVFDTLDELEEAARGGRDERRSREGYVALQDARAFLRLATDGTSHDAERDPVTKAYFRDLESPAPVSTKATDGPHPEEAGNRTAKANGAWVGRLEPTSDQKLDKPADERWLFATALAEVAQEAPSIADARKNEVAYLVNVLVSATQPLEQPLRPVEAMEVVMQVLSQGLLDRLLEHDHPVHTMVEHTVEVPVDSNAASAVQTASPAEVLASVTADALFRKGWRSESKLAQEVKAWRRRIVESLLRSGDPSSPPGSSSPAPRRSP